MNAEIIASGTELLLGEITDTNTPFLARQLAELGINLYYVSTVGDNFERYSATFKMAFSRSELIITTGGLGPTQGDITREVIANALGEELTIDPVLKDELTGFFTRLHLEMPENNLKQATIIPSACPLRNTTGTAPGWWVEKNGRTVIVLPGPPGELQTMWRNAVLPRLEPRRSAYIMSRILKTWGLSEAAVDQLVAPFLKSANPTLAMYARPDGIQLRITARDSSRDGAQEMISHREREIREILKDHIWGADDDTLEGLVAGSLSRRGLSLGVAESFTGGLLAVSLSAAAGEKEFFRGGLIIPPCARYSWQLGRTTPESAMAMAALARERFSASLGLAIDGPPLPEKGPPKNIFIAISGIEKGSVVTPGYLIRFEQAARRTINQALMALRNFVDSTT